MNTKRIFHFALLLFVPSLWQCTDSGLWREGQLERVHGDTPDPPPPPATPIRYSIGDVFCTTPSKDVVMPFKLLIAIDYSRSMDDSDPNSLRIDAVQDLISLYANEEFVYFGFVRFSDEQYETSLGKSFTNDPAVLKQVMSELRAAANNGSTNYQATLRWAWDAIDGDMRGANYIPGTRYGIIFVTDGRPNKPENAGSADADLLANRPKVRDLITGCNGTHAEQPLNKMIEFLNTYFINVAGDQLASKLLRDMATGSSTDPCGEDNWGHGAYAEVTNAGSLNLDVDLPKMRRTYINNGQVFLLNYNVRSYFKDGTMVLARDSDADGLVDDLEVENPTGPYESSIYVADTDSDGLNDYIETLFGTRPNVAENMGCTPGTVLGPLAPGPVPANPNDKDGDGLADCEERLLRSDIGKLDTDGDGLPDLLEVRAGLDPRDGSDAGADPDGDGVDSRTEVMTGMDPFHAESKEFREENALRFKFGKQFTVTEPDDAGVDRVRTCYEFSIENIPYLTVYDTSGQPLRRNILELDFVERTVIPLGPSEVVLRRHILYAEPDNDGPNYSFIKTYPDSW